MMARLGKHGRFSRCTRDGCGKTLDLTPPTYHKRACPVCAGKVIEREYKRDGKEKAFYACEKCEWSSTFPPPRVSKKPCSKCGAKMLLRRSARGEFWGCARYPECSHTMAVVTKGKRPACAAVAE